MILLLSETTSTTSVRRGHFLLHGKGLSYAIVYDDVQADQIVLLERGNVSI